MKRILSVLLCFIIIVAMALNCYALRVPQATEQFYVNDYSNKISASVEQELCETAYALDKCCGAQIVIVVINSISEFDAADFSSFANSVFNDWGIGDEKKDNGVLFIMSVEDDNYRVLQGKGLEITLDSGTIHEILDNYVEKYFAQGDYENAALVFSEQITERLKTIYNVSDSDMEKVLESSETLVPETKEESNGFLIFVICDAVAAAVIFAVYFVWKKLNEKKIS